MQVDIGTCTHAHIHVCDTCVQELSTPQSVALGAGTVGITHMDMYMCSGNLHVIADIVNLVVV